MLVALYESYHCLPCMPNPALPNQVFHPEVHRNQTDGIIRFIWPVLEGLNALDLPIMAHVSCLFQQDGQRTHIDDRVLVQLTTIPQHFTANGIPCTIIDGKLDVTCLWYSLANVYSPYELVSFTVQPAEQVFTSEFWVRFFLEKLARERHDRIAAATEAIMKLYAFLPETS